MRLLDPSPRAKSCQAGVFFRHSLGEMVILLIVCILVTEMGPSKCIVGCSSQCAVVFSLQSLSEQDELLSWSTNNSNRRALPVHTLCDHCAVETLSSNCVQWGHRWVVFPFPMCWGDDSVHVCIHSCRRRAHTGARRPHTSCSVCNIVRYSGNHNTSKFIQSGMIIHVTLRCAAGYSFICVTSRFGGATTYYRLLRPHLNFWGGVFHLEDLSSFASQSESCTGSVASRKIVSLRLPPVRKKQTQNPQNFPSLIVVAHSSSESLFATALPFRHQTAFVSFKQCSPRSWPRSSSFITPWGESPQTLLSSTSQTHSLKEQIWIFR